MLLFLLRASPLFRSDELPLATPADLSFLSHAQTAADEVSNATIAIEAIPLAMVFLQLFHRPQSGPSLREKSRYPTNFPRPSRYCAAHITPAPNPKSPPNPQKSKNIQTF